MTFHIPSPRATSLAFGALLATSLAASPPPAQAVGSGTEYDGSKVRIALAADLRSLGEKTLAAACRAARDAGQREAFLALAEEFDIILDGLRDGDHALGVPHPEESGLMHGRLDRVEGAWMEMRVGLDALAAGETAPGEAGPLAAAQAALIEQTEMLIADMAGRYSNAQEVLKTDALRIKFMERQRKLLGRMDRMICCMAAGFDELGTPESLAETMALFDASLLALRDGMPAAGVAAPRHEGVADMLDEGYRTWTARRGPLDAVVAGDAAADTAVVEMSALVKELKADMHNAATLAKVLSPGRTDALVVPIEQYVDATLAAVTADPALVAAIAAHNGEYADVAPEDARALDAAWIAGDAKGAALRAEIEADPNSAMLAKVVEDAHGYLTEIVALDLHGFNVALSDASESYWHGDEAAWLATVKEGHALHIGDVALDETTGLYQADVAMPVRDATGAIIGAVVYGIDVDRLF